MKIYRFKLTNGVGILEIIIALALFIIIASTGTATILSSHSSNRLAKEETQARMFAAEGIEAVRSIKTQGWPSPFLSTDCTTGCGLTTTNNKWEFGGTSNTFDSKFTRNIIVAPVMRNAGVIVESGGTNDPNTKKVTSTVTWNVTASRINTISFSTYLTNFRKAITALGQALLIYSDTSTTQKWRTYDNSTNSFSSENSTVVGEQGKTMTIKTSPTKTEAVTGYVSSGGTLHILCFDGSSWSEDWTQNVGGTGTTRRFDIEYEKTSGDVLVVYSTNTASSNELGYRTKPGSINCGSVNWSGHISQSAVSTDGVIQWVQLESNPTSGSNNIAVLWADNANKLSAMQWTGSSFGIAEPAGALETNLERVSVSGDVKSFDMAFESNSGNLMIVWGLYQASGCSAGTSIATTNCIRYVRYTSSWQSIAVIPTVADPATNIDISANPNSNELRIASLDNSQGDLSTAYWSGSVWTGRANVDTSSHCVGAGEMLVATGWLVNGAQTRSIIVYHDAMNNTCTTATTNIGAYSVNGNAIPITIADFNPSPAFASPQRWYDIQMDPVNKDQLMFIVSDAGSDLFGKRLTMTSVPVFSWSNSDGGSALETTLSQTTSSPFGFAYWRYQQP